MSSPPKLAFVTLGCPKNEVDSDRMAAAACSSGLLVTESLDDADVAVLNTCAFIQAATEESISEAFALAGEWRTARPGRKLIVAGCMVSRYGPDLAEAMPEPDAFLAVADEQTLPALVGELLDVEVQVVSGAARTPPGPTAYLKVSEGCDRMCAYCAIPAIRGPFRSTPPAEVLDEARFLVEHGAKELVLVGQDIASYGRDLPQTPDLSDLVQALERLDGDFRIRLMYVQPDGVTDALLDAMSSSSKVCRYLDIPLQHASAPVLRAMGRPGSAADHLRLISRIREALPDIVLRTTMIAGFPGETDADAEELERFVYDAGFDYVGVFAYSAEEGTRAATMPGQVPESTRALRAQRIRDAADAVGFSRVAERVGSVQRVLVELDEDGDIVGRTCGQAPEIDGVVILEGNLPVGGFADVRIIDAAGYDLVGAAL